MSWQKGLLLKEIGNLQMIKYFFLHLSQRQGQRKPFNHFRLFQHSINRSSILQFRCLFILLTADKAQIRLQLPSFKEDWLKIIICKLLHYRSYLGRYRLIHSKRILQLALLFYMLCLIIANNFPENLLQLYRIWCRLLTRKSKLRQRS